MKSAETPLCTLSIPEVKSKQIECSFQTTGSWSDGVWPCCVGSACRVPQEDEMPEDWASNRRKSQNIIQPMQRRFPVAGGRDLFSERCGKLLEGLLEPEAAQDRKHFCGLCHPHHQSKVPDDGLLHSRVAHLDPPRHRHSCTAHATPSSAMHADGTWVGSDPM